LLPPNMGTSKHSTFPNVTRLGLPPQFEEN
jgi:hypothetical protein